MDRTKNSIKNAISGMLLQVSTIFLSFFSRKIFLTYLGIENLGLNSLLNSVISVLSLSELGVYSAMTYALYEPLKDKDWFAISHIMTLFKRIYSIIAFVILTLGACLIPFLTYIVGETELSYSYIVYIYILTVIQAASTYFFSYKRSLIAADQKEYKIYKLDIIVKYLTVFGGIAVVVLTKSFPVFLYFSIIAGLANNIAMSIIVDKEYPEVKYNVSGSESVKYRKKLFVDVRYLFLNRLSGTISSSADNILLSMFSGLSYTGKYSNYHSINTNIEKVINSVSYGCSASMGNLLANKEYENAKRILKEITFLVFCIVCICCNCLVTVSTPFVAWLFGSEYVISNHFLIILIVIFYLRTMRYPGMIATDATGMFKIDKNVAILAMVLNIVSSIIFAYGIGYIGIFYGTIAAQLVVLGGKLYVFYRRYLKESIIPHAIYVLKLSCFTVATCALSWISCSNLYIKNEFLGIVVYGMLSLLISCLMIFAFFRKSEEYIGLKNRIMRLIKK